MSQVIHYDEAVQELHTLLDLARWVCSRFNQAELYFGHGTDSAWDEAVSLILQVLHLPQDVPESLFQARLTSSEKKSVMDIIQRRIDERIPAAYLTHQAWFCGMPFYVDERVLVPRSPFSELLNKGFEAWLDKPPAHVLDMCTGSACIAIAASQVFTHAQVDAVDLSEDALAVAQINIEGHGVEDRVVPIQSDLFANLKGHQYDLIICNPPYVDAEDMSDLPAEFHHEPRMGLAAGDDGLDLVHEILHKAPEHLSVGGWLFVEVGNSQWHMQQQYPRLPLQWVEFEQGGHGVFAIQREPLVAYLKEQEQ